MSERDQRVEVELPVAAAEALIAAQFPTLGPVGARFLGEGRDHQAFAVTGGWMFRFPKHAASERELVVERAVLPYLAARLPIPVPHFVHLGAPGPGFPFPFVGYRPLPGTQALHLDAHRVAAGTVGAQLGRLLGELHRIPIAEARDWGVDFEDSTRSFGGLRSRALEAQQLARRALPDNLVAAAVALIERPLPPAAGEPCLVHGALTEEHILLAPDLATVTGIVDWGHLRIGDRAADFAGLYHWLGGPLVDAALDVYPLPVDDGLGDRARAMAAAMALAEAAYGIDTGRDEYVTAAGRALRHSLA